MTYTCPFTEDEMQIASDTWGLNCGPASLAFALQLKLDDVRGKIPGFEERGYTSPAMMRQAIANCGKKIRESFRSRDITSMFASDAISLVRIQWEGPWTAPGANGKWAYTHTHWIVAWATSEKGEFLGFKATKMGLFVFDCNGGIMSFNRWKMEIVPLLTGSIKRATGGWFPTHVWRIEK